MPRTNNTGFSTKLPDYFFGLTSLKRWTDNFADKDGYERRILSPLELYSKYRRDRAYRQYLSRHEIRPKNMIFQRIRVTRDKYFDSTRADWWPKYYGAIFSVFVQPETFIENKQIAQYYILCPEDSELVSRYEFEEKGTVIPPRKLDEFVSPDPRLSTALVIPTSCGHHLRNETKAGVIEYANEL